VAGDEGDVATLLYETTDPEFANRALAALLEAGIPAYQTETRFSIPSYAPRRGHPTESPICLFIEQPGDASRANRILIELGAAVERPIPLPRLGYLILLVVVLLGVATFVAIHWRPS